MYERFTEAARRVVVRAQEEARELAHESIEAEHLLLALVAGPRAHAEHLNRPAFVKRLSELASWRSSGVVKGLLLVRSRSRWRWSPHSSVPSGKL